MSFLVRLHDATAAYGERVLWDHLNLDITPGEFVAILGPNGAGKTSLLRVLLGQLKLRSGRVEMAPDVRVGYVPQIKEFDPKAPIRGWDLVALGLKGRHLGLGIGKAGRERITQALAWANATAYAHIPLQMLSGGELQRLRIAQALVSDPQLLLCDEPLVSLDMGHQHEVCDVLGARKAQGTAILFVSHEINPIIDLIDRVVYVANGKAAIGSAREVMNSEVLSKLYGHPITVLEHAGSFFVIGAEDGTHHGPHGAQGGRECCTEGC